MTTVNCDICFEEVTDNSIVKLIDVTNAKYVSCCRCNGNICYDCVRKLQRSRERKCPFCRTRFTSHVSSEFVGTDYVNDCDLHMKTEVRNFYETHKIVMYSNKTYAVKRNDIENEIKIPAYNVTYYDNETRELMISMYDIEYPIGELNTTTRTIILFPNPKFMIVKFGVDRYAVTRNDRKRMSEGYDGFVPIYKIKNYNSVTQQFEVSIHDVGAPIGEFNHVTKKVKFF